MPVVLTARIGTFRLSASGCTPTAELDSVGPRSASTLFCWMRVCALAAEVGLSDVSSWTVRLICAPLTPPDPLIWSTASIMPSRLCGPYTPPAPVIERMAPSWIVFPEYELELELPPPPPLEPHAATRKVATSEAAKRVRFTF